MKKIIYTSSIEGTVTFFTNKMHLDAEKGEMIYNSYTFTSNVPLEIQDDADANELLFNGVFKEVK